ncbi:MAG TPA: hypothetical protein PLE16_14975 [Spirochaetota bacterium]|nr:hypothetical protein [Spirochaetota bacterium]
MKNLIFTASVLLLFSACSSDSSQTELSIKNSDQSDGSIKGIVWADGDAKWEDEVVEEGNISTAKEVKETVGRIECAVDDGSGFSSAYVTADTTGSDTVSIDEGSSNQVTITASK